jgi:hypothetical protein
MLTKSVNANQDTICLHPEGAADNSQGRKPLEPAREQKKPPQRGGAHKHHPVAAEGIFTTRRESRGFRPWLLSATPLGRRQADLPLATVGRQTHLLIRWLVAFTACTLVAHGCHVGDHGDADLVIRLIAAAGSGPGADSP